MKTQHRFAQLIPAISLAALLGMTPLAHAHKAGDLIVRAGGAWVSPNDTSGDVQGFPGNGVEVDDAFAAGLSITYMVTDLFSVDLLGASPFTHDVNATGPDLGGLGKIAEVTHLPPTLLANIHIPLQSERFHPYAGVGVNYTLFFDESSSESLEGALGESDVDLDDSIGAAFQVGLDWDFSPNIVLNLAVWWIDIDTTATINFKGDPNDPSDDGKTKVDVDIDPWVVMVGAGYRF
ncbi:OmpW/AlkL family protein [Algiphilus sp.]|uniref:OmpW/AlkL family protein n=1 Tax=Algiphilus sp. TaxID=1872431 RepID=UPI003B51FEE3